jgi:acylglycerol lipase
MVRSNFYLQTKEGFTLHGYRWRPDNLTPKAVIVLVHGLGEHLERYNHLADFFCQNHIAVIGTDLRGHGQSDGKRGHIVAFSQFLEDLELLINHTHNLYPDVKRVVYGHSLGGNIVARYSYSGESEMNLGYIISSPLLKLAFEPSPFKVKLGKFASKWAPGLLQGSGLNISHLSRDKAVCNAYKADPMVHDRISARMFTEMMDSAEKVMQFKGKPNGPVLHFHGSEDKITSAKASAEWASRYPDLVQFYLLEGVYHEGHNDLGEEKVFDLMLDWILWQLNR